MGRKSDLLRLFKLPCWAFDLDGVVVDSSQVHALAFQKVLGDIGIVFGDYASVAGIPTREVIESYLTAARGEAPGELVSELTARKQKEALDNMARGDGMRAFPGVEEVLRRARKAGKEVSLVTSASRERVDLALGTLLLRDSFRYVVTSEDAPRGKPNPDPYLAAMKFSGRADPADFLVFEDSENGIVSAAEAGMRVVQFSPGVGSRHPRADARFSSFAEVLEALGPE